jgi:hypothetical protein
MMTSQRDSPINVVLITARRKMALAKSRTVASYFLLLLSNSQKNYIRTTMNNRSATGLVAPDFALYGCEQLRIKTKSIRIAKIM